MGAIHHHFVRSLQWGKWHRESVIGKPSPGRVSIRNRSSGRVNIGKGIIGGSQYREGQYRGRLKARGKLLGLPTMTALLRQKRLRWVGHALRRDDSDLSKTEVKSEIALSSKPWTKCVLSDMQSLKIQTIKDLETKSKKREHFKMMTEARIL